MTPIDLQDRAQYLSLALFAQEVVSVLMEYVDENKSQNLKMALDEALSSLKGAESASVSSQRRAAAFASYEQLRTLEEVWKPEERAKAKRMIQEILREPDSPKAKPAANDLINLFSKLQDQALWNFEQPRPVSPGVMQRLCSWPRGSSP
jgi:hypothetical protein